MTALTFRLAAAFMARVGFALAGLSRMAEAEMMARLASMLPIR